MWYLSKVCMIFDVPNLNKICISDECQGWREEGLADWQNHPV